MLRLFSAIYVKATCLYVLIKDEQEIYFTGKREYLLIETEAAIIGHTYGSITLLNPPTMNEWPVKCYCGREKVVSTNELLRGIPNCSCDHKLRAIKDGSIGNWNILSDKVRLGKKYFFMCQCKCGKSEPKLIEKHNLETGKTFGCYKCRFRRDNDQK